MQLTTGHHQAISECDFLNAGSSSVHIWYRTDRKKPFWDSSDRLPQWVYDAVFNGTKGASAERDYYTPFKKGKDWLFSMTCLYQPRTGALLMAGSDLFVRAEAFEKTYLFKMGLEVNGKVILLPRGFWGSNPSDWDEHGGIEASGRGFEWYKSLPEPLALAYWNRFNGMDLPYDSVTGVRTWMMPQPAGWFIINHWLTDRYRGYWKKYQPWFDERFPDVKPKRGDGGVYFNFRCILEAFPRDETRSSSEVLRSGVDSLWIEIGAKEPLVYLVTNGELDKMRVLVDPVEAVDRYCEHVLLNRIERFDFHQFSRPLD